MSLVNMFPYVSLLGLSHETSKDCAKTDHAVE